MFEKFEKGYKSPNFNQPAPNPYIVRQYERMAKKRATWVHISKRPLYKYDRLGVPVFSHFTPGVTLQKATQFVELETLRETFLKMPGNEGKQN